MAVLVVLVPPFLCSPLTSDVTHYDVSARSVLRGGVAYRDVFDMNLPGMIWAHALVRSVVGWRSEALRAADLLVVAGIVGVLAWALRRLGLPRAAVLAFAALLAAFYLTQSEWCHCQRDTWMLLPALAALTLRRWQVDRLARGESWGRLLAAGLGEGLLWAAAFWIKPFVAVPGLACWLVSLVLARRLAGRLPGGAVADAAGLLAGGMLAGAAGVGWLWATGAWPYYREIVLGWNLAYHQASSPYLSRLLNILTSLGPWSLAHLVALPVALGWLTPRAAGRSPRPGADVVLPGLLAAFYLGWMLQIVLFQKAFHYTLVPPVFLALTVAAGLAPRPRRPLTVAGAAAALLGLACVQELVAQRRVIPAVGPSLPADAWQAGRAAFGQWLHDQAGRIALWGRCCREGSTPELRDRLTLWRDVNAAGWTELDRVAAFLREQGVGDGELTCCNNTTHPLWLMLDIHPANPYTQLDTLLIFWPEKREVFRSRLEASGQRWAVSDLRPMVGGFGPDEPPGADGPLALPDSFPPSHAGLFPWSSPIVFRTPRYLVHKVEGPVPPLAPPPQYWK